MRTLLAASLIVVAGALGAQQPEPAIIPRPSQVVLGRGTFRLSAQTVVVADRADSSVARHFVRDLEPATGFTLRVQLGGTSTANRIVFRRAPKPDTTLGTEGYRLEVKPGVVTITANEPAGAYYATQTIRQLLPPAIFRDAPIGATQWTIPAVSIVDRPRFAWRGMHLDVARHFMPKEFVKKYIDLLALHKMNSFHWHLTDDQGWRIEIKRYPRLTAIGAWRSQTLVGHVGGDSSTWVYDKKPHGGFYTQEDVREIVAYARERFVNIVPEIEMPGHSQAAIAAYPQLGNFGDSIKPWGAWGVSPYILNPSDSTIAFMQDVLTEVMALFPGPFIHVGGDEAIKPQWKASPLAQSRMQALGLKTEDELQSWFITQMDRFLSSHGRRLIGWDEILDGGLAPNATVMSWRGTNGGITAARAGHDVVMTPGSHTYFDHYQSQNTAAEPLAIGGFLPIDTVYSYDPLPTGLEPELTKHILGAQAQVWTEYIEGPKNVEYMAFPREAALAEALWTLASRKDFADFSRRLSIHESRLEALDVNYRRTPAVQP